MDLDSIIRMIISIIVVLAIGIALPATAGGPKERAVGTSSVYSRTNIIFQGTQDSRLKTPSHCIRGTVVS